MSRESTRFACEAAACRLILVNLAHNDCFVTSIDPPNVKGFTPLFFFFLYYSLTEGIGQGDWGGRNIESKGKKGFLQSGLHQDLDVAFAEYKCASILIMSEN